MSRKMQTLEGGSVITVHEHIILSNCWEYYVYELPDENGIGDALVMGFETEAGSFSIEEIKPYIISRTKELSDVMPPTGYKWIENDN